MIRITEPVQISGHNKSNRESGCFYNSEFLPENFADLLILDPPYNLTKTFNSSTFKRRSIEQYAQWFENLIRQIIVRLLKKTASVYVCSEWFTSTAIHLVLEKYLKVRNQNHMGTRKRQRSKKELEKCFRRHLVCDSM